MKNQWNQWEYLVLDKVNQLSQVNQLKYYADDGLVHLRDLGKPTKPSQSTKTSISDQKLVASVDSSKN